MAGPVQAGASLPFPETLRGKKVLLATESFGPVNGVSRTTLNLVTYLRSQGVNVAVLVILAISIAASANFPVIVLSLFWRRFNTAGVIGGMATGLVSSVALALLGPAFLGAGAVFPIVNPAILSMPLGFLGAALCALLGRREPDADAHFDAVLFQAHTGRVPA